MFFYDKIKTMATRIYKTNNIFLFDGTEIEVSPLKIKYLRQFMDVFSLIKEAKDNDEYFNVLLECTRICMKQHYPEISKSVEILEDNIDLLNMKKVLEYSAGIKIDIEKEDDSKEKTEINNKENNNSWEDLDLAKLEAEVFLIGGWKNFNELEESLCIEELLEIINNKRELDYNEKKFFAAIQGVDLDKNSDRGQKEWEDMKARVFSRGKATDSNDILALQGQNAVKAGFGIGMGIDYEDLRSS